MINFQSAPTRLFSTIRHRPTKVIFCVRGVLSPLLTNINLDDLDKELESRGLSFCRYADDVVIFVKSERSGQRILSSLTDWIAKHLKLRVNPNKSGTGRPWHGKFLGFRINSDGTIKLAQASLEKLKDQVRYYWNNQNRQALEERIKTATSQTVSSAPNQCIGRRVARSPTLNTVLNNARLKRWGLWVPSNFVTP